MPSGPWRVSGISSRRGLRFFPPEWLAMRAPRTPPPKVKSLGQQKSDFTSEGAPAPVVAPADPVSSGKASTVPTPGAQSRAKIPLKPTGR